MAQIDVPPMDFSWEGDCAGRPITFIAEGVMRAETKKAYFWQIEGLDTWQIGPRVTHTFDKGGHYKVSLWAASEGDTMLLVHRAIFIKPTPKVFPVWADTVCQGSSATLAVQETEGYAIKWVWEDSVIGENAIIQTPPLHESQVFWTYILDSANCWIAKQPVQAAVMTHADLQIELEAEEVLLGEAVVFDPVAAWPVGHWEWSFGDETTDSVRAGKHVYDQAGVYTLSLMALSTTGCSLRAEREILVKPVTEISFPGSFSPNGDGISDTFSGTVRGLKSFTLKIFNRAGTLVYQTQNMGFAWNGKNLGGAKLNSGVYLVEAIGEDHKGNPVKKRFNLLLIR